MNIDEYFQTFTAKCCCPIRVLNHHFSLIQGKIFALVGLLEIFTGLGVGLGLDGLGILELDTAITVIT